MFTMGNLLVNLQLLILLETYFLKISITLKHKVSLKRFNGA